MRRAGLLVGQTLALLVREARAGMTTLELDALAEDHIRADGGIPNFQLVPGYRHTLCTSVNEEVVHGIPGPRVLQDGDLLSIDCGAQVQGWNGDAAVSLVIGGDDAGTLSDRRLIDTTEASMWAGVTALAVDRRLFEVGEAVEASIEVSGRAHDHDYGIVEEYVGHGIGRTMHEDPQIPNYGVREHGPLVRDGFTGAIEPMVTWGSPQTRVLDDDWTVVTVDGSRAAHWESSVAVTAAGLWVLTALDGGQAELARLGAAYAPLGD
ncbi:MAG: type I methionyl aminopeptidase [Actinomycetota bacterium]|nr:type I methionyl aminopeptidase [Actinomycetota bacterium]